VARRSPTKPLTAGAARVPSNSLRRGHYDDPRYYDKAYRARTADVAYYRELAARHGGPVLEYGVGNGRVALELARAGLHVVGVDSSRAMLAHFEEKLADEAPALRTRLRLVRGDMRKKRLSARFGLVIAPFNVVLHLDTEDDLAAFLERVREHLEPGGKFVFDFSMPHAEDLALDPERWYGAPRFRDPKSGKLVRYHERFDYDGWTQRLTMTFRFTPVDGSAPWETELVHRQWFPRELASALEHHGFPRQRWTADFTSHPPDCAADSLVVECEPDRGRKVV
jgi:SAM-dependent methyltransferase